MKGMMVEGIRVESENIKNYIYLIHILEVESRGFGDELNTEWWRKKCFFTDNDKNEEEASFAEEDW